ncbi:MAG TPA: TIGR02444 family protein [Stellaceae bacterium]
MTDRLCAATAGDAPAAAELWRFSTRFYARRGVAEALLGLQDRDGCDINLVLFALWLGISGRKRATRALFAAAERDTRALRRELVEPLRALRRRLKGQADPDLRRLRAEVQALELAAEQAVQRRLASHAGPVFATDRAERLAAAQANFRLYLGRETAETAVICAALAAFAEQN